MRLAVKPGAGGGAAPAGHVPPGSASFRIHESIVPKSSAVPSTALRRQFPEAETGDRVHLRAADFHAHAVHDVERILFDVVGEVEPLPLRFLPVG